MTEFLLGATFTYAALILWNILMLRRNVEELLRSLSRILEFIVRESRR